MSESSFKSSWQVLSAQSARTTSWFVVILFFNYCMVWLNMRVPYILERSIYHQLFWMVMAGCFLGGMELLSRRQELIASLPFSRRKLFCNRLIYGLILVLICTALNYTLDSGLAEHALYDEIWLSGRGLAVTISHTVLLTSVFAISFSLSIVAQTLSGLLLGGLATMSYFLPLVFIELPITDVSFICFLSILALIFTITSFWNYGRSSQVKTSISTITNIRLVAILYWLSLIALIVFTISKI